MSYTLPQSYLYIFTISPHFYSGGQVSVTLGDVLIFATGLNQIPAMGFIPQPNLEFLHPMEASSHFPKANTCALILRIPVGLSFEEFKDKMEFGIGGAEQFGEA